MGVTDGYVIYERYYVDKSHALLKGPPPQKVARVEDTFVAPREEAPRKPQPTAYDSFDNRSREPARFDEAKDPYAVLSTPQSYNSYGQSNTTTNSSYGRERSPMRRDQQPAQRGNEQPIQRGNEYSSRDAGYTVSYNNGY
jgi:hypothetical protein